MASMHMYGCSCGASRSDSNYRAVRFLPRTESSGLASEAGFPITEATAEAHGAAILPRRDALNCHIVGGPEPFINMALPGHQFFRSGFVAPEEHSARPLAGYC